jgi:hypothetical protein
MGRFTLLQVGILLLALVFILGGAVMVLFPEAAIVPRSYGGEGPSETSVEYVSATGMRVSGILALLFGIGMVVLVIYDIRHKP